MQSSDWSDSLVLAEWADRECRHLDLIASWEELLSVYAAMGFRGPDTDDQQLVEFKAVITELNKFLTRMKNGLAKAQSVEAAIEFLSESAYATEMNQVKSRQGIAYNKLKQHWVMRSIMTLRGMAPQAATEGERDAN